CEQGQRIPALAPGTGNLGRSFQDHEATALCSREEPIASPAWPAPITATSTSFVIGFSASRSASGLTASPVRVPKPAFRRGAAGQCGAVRRGSGHPPRGGGRMREAPRPSCRRACRKSFALGMRSPTRTVTDYLPRVPGDATFLFADIAGFTALTEAHGDE